MHTRTMVRGFVAAAALALTAPMATTAANAATTDFTWSVAASTHIKSVNQTVTIPTGTLKAKVDTATGKLTGNLTLPNAAKRMSYSTIPLADVTVGFIQAAPVTGTYNQNSGKASATAKFTVQVVSIRPAIMPFVNLVGNNCKTASAGTVNLSGPINLGGTSTLSAGYQLPEFKNCGGKAIDTAVSLALAGKGNTMTAKLS